jgi:hypothetical protein
MTQPKIKIGGKGFGRAKPFRNFVATWRAEDGTFTVGTVEAAGLHDACDAAFKSGQAQGLLLTRIVDPVSKETVVLQREVG